MDDAPLPIIQTPKEEIKESFEIRQEDKNYILNINIINQEIILNTANLYLIHNPQKNVYFLN